MKIQFIWSVTTGSFKYPSFPIQFPFYIKACSHHRFWIKTFSKYVISSFIWSSKVYRLYPEVNDSANLCFPPEVHTLHILAKMNIFYWSLPKKFTDKCVLYFDGKWWETASTAYCRTSFYKYKVILSLSLYIWSWIRYIKHKQTKKIEWPTFS